MNCPFCQNKVLPKAYACGHCGRDLVPWLALLGDLEEQARRLERIEKVLGMPSDLHQAAGVPLTLPSQAPELPPVQWHWQRLAFAFGLTALGLVFAHWLLLFVYDASPVILRVVTIAMPVMFALAVNARSDVDWRSNAIMATLLALISVAAMLGVTAWLDEVPWLPDNKRDWRETFEYVVSILLAWVTGHLIGLALNKGHRLIQEKKHALLLNNGTLPKISDISEQLQKVAAVAAPVASGLAAAYSGLKSLVGNG